MPQIRYDIISIGTLARNLLWNERQTVRTPHTTTTLIQSPQKTLLVDPGLPPAALAARLFERTALPPSKINAIFLTNFHPHHRAALPLFPNVPIFISELEKQSARQQLELLLATSPPEDVDHALLEKDLALLDRCKEAPDELIDQLSLFPLPGPTPGHTGLLLALPLSTILIAGDAVPSRDHFLAGQVLPDSHDLKAAQEALAEVYEIADLIIPGYDNIFQNPRVIGA